MQYNKRFKAAPNRREWFGFDLCQGHIFGIRNGIPYVSAAEPEPRKGNFLKAYCAHSDGNYYRWRTVYLDPESDLGQDILRAKSLSPYDGVQTMPDRMSDERRKISVQVQFVDGIQNQTRQRAFHIMAEFQEGKRSESETRQRLQASGYPIQETESLPAVTAVYVAAMFPHWPPESEGNNTSRKDHVTLQPPKPKPVRTWTDQICSDFRSQSRR